MMPPGTPPSLLWTHAANTASLRVAEHAGFRHQPGRDGQVTVRGQSWPARWYTRSLR